MSTLMEDLEGILFQLFPRVTVDITWNDAIILEKIIVATPVRNQGIGTKVLKYICEFADNNQVSIILTPNGTFGGDVKRLRKFYARFGFAKYGKKQMKRVPKG